MPSNYSSYQGIDPFYITLFDRLWERYTPQLPLLPTEIQSEENTRAAVFNLWVNFYDVQHHLLIKTEKTFSHAYVEHLVKRLKSGTPQHLKPIVQTYRSKHHHAFLYCYLLVLQVQKELALFVTQHETLELEMFKKYNYYFLSDIDFEPNDGLFLIIKILNYEFIQLYLTQQKCEHMHEFAHQEMQAYLNDRI